jgi:peptidoglycan/xylan/chitin deacetylase (PgdA/CDA1 family)
VTPAVHRRRRIATAVLVAVATASATAGAVAGRGGPATPAQGPAPTPHARSAPATPAPATDVASVAARAGVPVLCYHQIRRPTAADGAQARPYIVSPAAFARQMQALDRAGYTTITGDALVAHVARGAPLPRKPVLVTFDDGTAGQVASALPVLRRHRFTATFFVMTVVLGRPGWLSRAGVRALDRAGMTIAAHTWDHHAVTGYADADWPKQIDEPVRDLAALVGHPIKLFAYPFGLWDARAFAHLRAAGLTAAFQLSGRMDAAEPLWTLRRIIVPEWSGRRLLQEIRRDF